MNSLKILVLSLLFLISPILAASQTAKITQTIGQVEFQKKGKGNWKDLKVGALIRHADRIRTYGASSTELLFENGSKIIIQENSIINMKELTENGPVQNTNVEIRSGQVLFDIKKLTSASSSYKFETPTATAAIRGTSGGIGYNGSKTSAYLDEGGLQIIDKNSGKEVKIGAKELAVQLDQGFEVKSLDKENQVGEVFKAIMQDTTLNEITVDSLLLKIIEIQDSVISPGGSPLLDSLNALDTLNNNSKVDSLAISNAPVNKEITLEGSVESYDKKPLKPELKIKGICKDISKIDGSIKVSVGVFNTEVVADKWELSIFWPNEEEGTKNFEVLCKKGDKEISLGVLNPEYYLPKLPLKLNLSTPEKLVVSEGYINIKGTYEGYKSRLSLIVGKQNIDLTDPNGSFDYKLEINDKNQLTQLSQIELKLSNADASLKKTIQLKMDWKSKKINTIVPTLNYSKDLVNGKVLIALLENLNDFSTIEVIGNSNTLKKIEKEGNVSGISVNLLSGKFDYKIRVTDQAGNQSEYVEKDLEYWSRVDLRLNVQTSTGGNRIKVPPLPPGVQKNLQDKIQITIDNLPKDDIGYVEEIQIINSATNFTRILKGSELDRVRFELLVPLKRGNGNKLIVRVKPKNGITKEVVKNIELTK